LLERLLLFGDGGMEPGTGAKQAAYAPGEGGTAGSKGGGESFLPDWLSLSSYCAILELVQSDKSALAF